VSLTRVATSEKKTNAVEIVVDKTTLTIERDDLATLYTAAKLKAAVEQQASLASKELPRLFFHINDDGSIAVATGTEPDVWPEDDPTEAPQDVKPINDKPKELAS